MMPGRYDLSVYRGDTQRWRFVLWADAGKTEPADLTGATAAAHIRQANTTSKPPVDLECVVEAPNFIDMTLLAADAASLPAPGHSGVWDLQVTWPSGDVQTVLAGNANVLGDVTRAVA